MASLDDVGAMRAIQNYATSHVLLQPTGAPYDDPAQMAPAVKLFPFTAWPAGEPGVLSGHGRRPSPTYYFSGAI